MGDPPPRSHMEARDYQDSVLNASEENRAITLCKKISKFSIYTMKVKKWNWKSLSHVRLCDQILQARILEWVAFLFSRRSSQPKDWTQVFCIAGILYQLSTREAQEY